MRRKEKEVKDQGELQAIIEGAEFCHLAMVDGDQPYVIPLNFGYRDNTLYFHSAREGRKLDILRRHDRVGFAMEAGVQLVEGGTACDWSVTYRSVVGFGRASLIEEAREKKAALDVIMAHYAKGSFEYREKGLEQALIIKVRIDEMTGKRS